MLILVHSFFQVFNSFGSSTRHGKRKNKGGVQGANERTPIYAHNFLNKFKAISESV